MNVYTIKCAGKDCLEIQIPNTPAIECKCGKWFQLGSTKFIVEKSETIQRYFEFLKDEDRARLMSFLSIEDIEKIRQYALSMRTEPFFQHEFNMRSQ